MPYVIALKNNGRKSVAALAALATLANLCISEIKIMFPVRAVNGLLPVGGNDIAIFIERAMEALRKPRKVPPYRPNPTAVRHPIYSGNTTRIIVKHAIGFSLIVRTHDRCAARKGAGGNLRMLNEKGSALHPGEFALPPHYSRGILVKGHGRDFYTPLPDKHRQLIECRVGFERCLLILFHHKAPLKVLGNKLH